jgi:hypothetical protein
MGNKTAFIDVTVRIRVTDHDELTAWLLDSYQEPPETLESAAACAAQAVWHKLSKTQDLGFEALWSTADVVTSETEATEDVLAVRKIHPDAYAVHLDPTGLWQVWGGTGDGFPEPLAEAETSDDARSIARLHAEIDKVST